MLPDSSALSVVDTNVLVEAHYDDARYHRECFELLDRAKSNELQLAVTPQILMEFFSVSTNGRRMLKPYSPHEMLVAIQRLLALPGMQILPFPDDVFDRTQQLLKLHPVAGPAIYDVQIAATMLSHGVTSIFTYDKQGFVAFDGITVQQP